MKLIPKHQWGGYLRGLNRLIREVRIIPRANKVIAESAKADRILRESPEAKDALQRSLNLSNWRETLGEKLGISPYVTYPRYILAAPKDMTKNQLAKLWGKGMPYVTNLDPNRTYYFYLPATARNPLNLTEAQFLDIVRAKDPYDRYLNAFREYDRRMNIGNKAYNAAIDNLKTGAINTTILSAFGIGVPLGVYYGKEHFGGRREEYDPDEIDNNITEE